MNVSVVVSTFTKERTKDVLRCINSILNQTTKPDEILLVLDPVDELVEFYEDIVPNSVKIVKSNGFGLSSARNTGIEKSKGEIIAFIDDDAWADKRWLENMLENYADKDIYGVGGKIIPIFETGRPRWLAEELDWIVGCTYKGMSEQKAEVRNPIGANMSFRREAFEVGLFRTEVGRYGKKLVGSEETEFSMRLKKVKPVKILYDPKAVVYHRVPGSRVRFRYALKRAYYEGYSKARLAKEYPLSGEYRYLSYLVKKSLPSRVKSLFLPNSLLEFVGLITVMSAVAVGNFVGRIRF
jgi:glycosyltransferase involved in cell wall biosynthesis